ncbi:MAG: S-layer homology domain-containing protein [Chloroflexia bacterium]
MRKVIALLGLLFAVYVAGSFSASAAYPPRAKEVPQQAGQDAARQADVRSPARSDVSPPLRSIAPIRPQYDPTRPLRPEQPVRHPKPDPAHPLVDPVVQSIAAPLAMPTPLLTFDGIPNYWGGYPPDTNGEVGPNHYVQTVNIGFQIWNKSGVTLYGPANFNTLFTGFGGPCEIRNDGDPIVVYDQMADRWLITQFTTSSPYYQCMALSTSGDPTGSYYRYAYLESSSIFGDYPHFGVWPDAYYMTVNEFNGPGGGGNYAFERSRMLAGDPAARAIYFHTTDSGLLPSDMDGHTAPPVGSPNYILEWYDNSSLREFRFHVDWATPASSTFTGPFTIPVASFSDAIGGIEQPGTSVRLDDLSDRLMFRVAYRNLGDHESLVANHSVVGTGGKAGIRWYEIRNPNATPTAYQQGTFSPDATHRWMGSIAMDHLGNIAVGYSASSTTLYPSIRYAGRLVTDTLGLLAQGEATLYAGSASQTGDVARWGDYSDLTVDPADDCTFWYTTEYLNVTGERTWRTRIGSFKFPNCVAVPTPTVTGVPPTISPTHTRTSTPLPSATACLGSVTYTGAITNTDSLQTGRVALRAPASFCSTPKSCAGAADSVPRHYRAYNYVNSTNAPQCVSVNLDQACGSNAIWSVAYLNTFNPASLCTNYLADGGRGGPNTFYSFTLPAGATAIIVVNEVSADVGCDAYTLRINPCGSGTSLTPTPTSTAPASTSTPTTGPSSTAVSLTSTPTSTASSLTTTPTSTPGIPTITTTPANPTSTSTPCTITFTDVHPTDYYYDPVTYLYCHGAISGYADNTFRPGNLTTRGQLTKIVTLAEGWPIYTPPSPTFRDVRTTDTFYQYIETAYSHNIISGYSCGTGTGCLEFRPGNNVTRAQLTKIVVLAQNWEITPPSVATFRDVPLGDTFYGYIETAYSHSIISGYDCGTGCLEFRPGNNATRGQISKIVYLAVTGP